MFPRRSGNVIFFAPLGTIVSFVICNGYPVVPLPHVLLSCRAAPAQTNENVKEGMCDDKSKWQSLERQRSQYESYIDIKK